MVKINLPGKPDPENIRRLDMIPIPMIRRMMRYGIAIDREYFHALTSKLEQQMESLKGDIICEIPPASLDAFMQDADSVDDFDPINVNSRDQLADLLFNHLDIGKGRELKMTKSGKAISTGKKQLELLKQTHPVIDLILQYRERAKLVSTYTRTLPLIAKFHPSGSGCPCCGLTHKVGTYRIHTQITTTRTDTGRLASKSPNLQNIPAKTQLGREVRAGFIASPGTRLISCDYAQIELRLLAHCSQDPRMLEVFRANGDIHTATAMSAFNLHEHEVDKLLHRAPCKNLNFGIVYGLTEAGLYDQMALTYATAGVPLPPHITVDWCRDFIQQWFGVYSSVHPYMQLQYYRARRYGVVWDLFGRCRRVPEVRSVHKRIRAAGERQAGNMPIQSTAAGVMKIGMGLVEERLVEMLEDGLWCWPLIPVHDELIIEADEEIAEGVCDLVMERMSAAMPECRVPVLADGKTLARWEK